MTTTETGTLARAVNAALRDAMRDDGRVLVFGEDVGRLGGVFRVTDGLADRFGEDRCFDTPLAESGILGTAIGMAMYGLRPVVEMQFDAFAYPAFEQLVSHAAKFRSRTGGRMGLPLVVRVPYGGGIGGVEHHSDSSEAYYAHTPGLHVAVPSHAADAYRLLRAAIATDDPVVFFEPKRLYWTDDDTPPDAATAGYGRAAVLRAGRTATLIAYGPSVPVARRAAEQAAARGQDVEVIDLRTLVPLDEQTLVASVRRTGRAVVVHESHGFCGVGAEVSALLMERCFDRLAAPVRRVAGLDMPYPPPHAERFYLPSVERIAEALDAVHARPARRAPATPTPAGDECFRLPDLGEGLTEAEIVTWLVAPGDEVATDQPVVEVETAKSMVEVPTPYAGRVLRLHAEAGQRVDVGAPLLTVAPANGPSRALVGYGTVPGGDEVEIPLTGARGTVARRMTAGHREIPDVTIWLDVDATDLLAARARSGAERPSLLAVLACHAVDGLRRFPVLNSRVDTGHDTVVQLSRIHLGLAVQSPRGLLVPAVRDAHELSGRRLAAAVDRVAAAARTGEPISGGAPPGTFTVNNYGPLGVDGATPIINHPEVAMLGMGRVVDRPRAVGGEVVVRRTVTLSLTFDHRVCDGDVAAGFLTHVGGLVEAGLLPGPA